MAAIALAKRLLKKYLVEIFCTPELTRVPNLIGIFGGSGRVISTPEVVEIILEKMQGNNPNRIIKLLYIAAATYDIPELEASQAAGFQQYPNIVVDFLRIANDVPESEMAAKLLECKTKIAETDVICVGGGNTLYLVDRMKKFGVPDLMREEAKKRKILLCGGSAGAICWADGGHSDSGDPKTFKAYMEAEYAGEPVEDPPNAYTWDYIRVPGISFLPGIICPHADATQSNGILRETDFNEMMLRHETEVGICLDNYGYVVIDNGHYEHRKYPSVKGSDLIDGDQRDVQLKLKKVVRGELKTIFAPGSGKVSDVFGEPKGGVIKRDPRCIPVRLANV